MKRLKSNLRSIKSTKFSRSKSKKKVSFKKNLVCEAQFGLSHYPGSDSGPNSDSGPSNK